MVRKANEKDVDFIFELAKALPELNASKNEVYRSKEEILEWINDDKSIVLVKENEGFIFAKLLSSNWCMIDAIAIKTDSRGKGTSTQLLNELYSILKEKNINYVSGLVLEDSKEARNFWNKQGYSEGKELIWIEKHLK
jgi:N-acetylglutamate synthase-like GNAT family acetyltransferase